MKRTSSGMTDVGCVRETNQDSFLIHDRLGLYVVADGMGGHAAGELASSLAVKTIYETFANFEDPEATVPDLTQVSDDEMYFERLKHAINRSSQVIRTEAARRPGCRGMGTTTVILVVDGHKAYLAHAGDSRAYLVRSEGIRRLTRDHTWVADQIRAGLLTEQQAATSQFRNLLTRSVGLDARVESDCSSRRVEVGDRFVLCSDGLHGLVSDTEIYRIVFHHPPKVSCEKLIALAKERGGPDNITAVVVAFDDEFNDVPTRIISIMEEDTR